MHLLDLFRLNNLILTDSKYMNIKAAMVIRIAIKNLLLGSCNYLFLLTREKKTPIITTKRYL